MPVTDALPLFFSVNVFAALVAPTAVLANFALAGVNVTPCRSRARQRNALRTVWRVVGDGDRSRSRASLRRSERHLEFALGAHSQCAAAGARADGKVSAV